MPLVSQKTTATFKQYGKEKKIVFAGSVAQALTVIDKLYPSYCCFKGTTLSCRMSAGGNYTITDVLTGKVEHEARNTL